MGRVIRTKKLSLKVPPGVDTGLRLRMTGEGEPGELGGPPGDLYVELHVRDHDVFERHGDDVVAEVPITYSQAVLGGRIEIPTLEGTDELEIPSGTFSGQHFRLKGKGIPHLRGRGRGDLIALVYVHVPTRVSKDQEELLRRLAELDGADVAPKKKGLFSRKK